MLHPNDFKPSWHPKTVSMVTRAEFIRFRTFCRRRSPSHEMYTLRSMFALSPGISLFVDARFRSAVDNKFVLKEVSQTSFIDYQNIYQRIRGCPNLRIPCDIIPGRSTFVYNHLSDHLLSLAQEDPPLSVVRHILKGALHGLAKLHEKDVVHTGSYFQALSTASAVNVNILQTLSQTASSSNVRDLIPWIFIKYSWLTSKIPPMFRRIAT